MKLTEISNTNDFDGKLSSQARTIIQEALDKAQRTVFARLMSFERLALGPYAHYKLELKNVEAVKMYDGLIHVRFSIRCERADKRNRLTVEFADVTRLGYTKNGKTQFKVGSTYDFSITMPRTEFFLDPRFSFTPNNIQPHASGHIEWTSEYLVTYTT